MYKAPLSAESLMEQEVRQLFERHTIAEIKVREDLTRDEIEKKKHELRRLVGTRYRDLIDSADSVIAMKTAAEGLAGCFERLDHHTARLLAHLRKPGPTATAANGTGAATDSAGGGEEERNRAAHRERYHVALQVKLLVDAPEQIWSSVEANDYLKATLLYTRAEQAHSRLVHNPAFAQLLKSIPLMPRQWSLISQFPSEIRQNARAQLQKSGVSPQHYAGSLCALVLLDHLSVTQALNVFLEAQKTLVLSLFDTSSSNALPLDELVERMCRLVRWVQHALFLLGIVFSSHFAATAFGLPASLLTQCLRAPDTTSLTAATAASSSSSQQTIAEADLERGCKMWLDSIAESLRWGLRHALLQIKLAKDLDHIRQRVLQAMDNPEFPAVPGDVTKFPSPEEIWKHVCGLVIKRGLDVWDFVFNEAFTEASRNVIQLWFRSVNLGLVSSSSSSSPDALNLLRSDEDLSMGHYVWRVEAGRVGAATTPLSRRGEAFDTLRQKAATLTPRLAELVGHLDHQLEACMLDLAHLLHHLATPTTATTDWHGSGSGSGSGTYSTTRRRRIADAGSGSTATAAATYMMGSGEEEAEREARRREREEKERGRELKLREFLQDSCHQALSALLAQLDDKLTALGAPSEAGGKEQQASVEERTEQALLIGRACRAIVQHSVQLKRIFALPKTTQPGMDAGALKGKGYSYTAAKAFNRRLALKHSQDEEADNVLHPKLQELQSTFRRLSLRAHVRWVHILAHTLLTRLGEALQADDWSEREKRRMQWQPITVAVESLDEGGKGGQAAKGGGAKAVVVEETFYLPYQASPYVLSFLFSACREIHRTFAHAPDHAVLHYLASQLLLGVCGHYWRLANAAEVRERVSKEGAIQLMFDAKFLCDALAAGAAPPHAADPDLAKAVLAESATSHHPATGGDLAEPSAIKDRIKALHNQLQTLLDPIDRAFYGPHVNRMEQQCYARSAALLGPLVSLHPLYTDVKVQGAHGDQYNTLPMVASAPRFRYLPITEPVVKGKEKGPVASSFGLDLPSGHQQQQLLPQFAGDRFGARLPSSPLLSASTPQSATVAAGGADGSAGVVGGSFMEQVRKFGFGGFLGAEDGSALGSATLKSFLS